MTPKWRRRCLENSAAREVSASGGANARILVQAYARGNGVDRQAGGQP